MSSLVTALHAAALGAALLSFSTPSACAQSALVADAAPPAPLHLGAHFAQSIALSGDRLVAGAPHTLASGQQAGGVHVFERAAIGTWNLTATLLPPTPQSDDDYGYAVATIGNLLLVGARVDELTGGTQSSGVASIFERQLDASWLLRAELTIAGAKSNDDFGAAVALRPARALVGARGRDLGTNDEGAAYVFEPGAGGTWVQKAELRAAVPKPHAYLGWAVALHGERALLGAPSTGDGTAHVFERAAGGAWNDVATLRAPDAYHNDQFGTAVAFAGDRAAIGAFMHTHQGVKRGAVYVFERNAAAQWVMAQEIRSLNGTPGEQFGWSVALEGDEIAVGAPANDEGAALSGRAYRFLRNPAGAWEQADVLAMSPPQNVAAYGLAIALSNGRCAVGAPYAKTAGTFSGRAYVYDLDALDADAASLSLSAGGSVNLAIEAGFTHAGELALLLGSASGTLPGQSIAPGLLLPLNADAYFLYTLAQPNHAPLSGSLQLLGAGGVASAAFTLPAGSAAALAGTTVHHAFATIDVAAGAATFASNARGIASLP